MKKILVIEDTASTRNLFLEAIKAKGFYTIGAENGLIGVQRAQEDLPDLIISEIAMSKLDGYSVLTKLRQNPDTEIIPLIFVTTKVSKADIRKGMEMGADDYLTKPCTVQELLRAIAACLEKRAFLQQCYTAQSQPVPKPPLADTTRQFDLESIFPYDPDLMEVFHFIEANYHRPITLSNVANAVGYSSPYLTNWVRRQTGQTVQNWIIQRRMAAARFLLLKTNERIEEIAMKVGYQNLVHFFRQFRTNHGTTPQAWRKLQLSQEKEELQKC
ncbi:DNA-binding response regulator [Nostoc sp. CHAB 5784]|uniref:response regulator transcription factor n=1 Tax=Nostoc mirabile TaxID=2907820 RepID=UPI001E4FB488|nr:DNA-binding response regulator [Nostoc mirabile]MCC5668408.1 DNA-binding response regulator [Nostoc mirabile CHAB5784]